MESNNTEKNYLKTLRIIFGALAGGQIAFALILLLTQTETYFSFTESVNALHFIVPIISISAILITQIFFKQNIKFLKQKDSVNEKLAGYQTHTIIKLAILEFPTLMACVAFSLNGNLYFMLIVFVMVFYFLLQIPTAKKITTALNLDIEYFN